MADSKTPRQDPWADLREEIAPDGLIRDNKDFIVFLRASTLEVDWKTSDAYDREYADQKSARAALQSAISDVECSPCDGMERDLARRFQARLAEAMALGLTHDFDLAKTKLKAALQYINARAREQARARYLSASACCCGCVVIAGSLVSGILYAIHIFPTVQLVSFDAIVGGSLGAMFSVTIRNTKETLDPDTRPQLHTREAAARIFAGVVGAIAILCAMKSQLLLPQLQNNWGAFLACMIGGYSERLVTNLCDRVASMATAAGHGRLPASKTERGER